MKNQSNNYSNIIKNKKNIFTILFICIVITVIICLFQVAYAKYRTKVDGSANSEIAEMICNMEVEASAQGDKTIINPFCNVTVKNYNKDSNEVPNVTETDVRYTIKVSPKEDKEDFVMPEYYWEEFNDRQEDADGTIVVRVKEGTSAEDAAKLSGVFRKSENGEYEQEEHTYKIVFINPGVEDIDKIVEFDLIAEQD